ncbi:MAG: type 1 glutamine amidotransferase [Luteibaculaceae bacterium]
MNLLNMPFESFDNVMFNVAIIDMNNNALNQGLRSVIEVVRDFARERKLKLSFKVFNVRVTGEVPDLSFDAYISTGGPGSPLDSEGSLWENNFFTLLEDIREHNAVVDHDKKPVFLICHSFQLYCRYHGFAEVNRRKSNSFGIFPMHKTEAGKLDDFLDELPDPYYAVDSRDYQVINVDFAKLQELGAKILCREKIRPHVPLERAVMAIRFSPYIFGTQFHPEADPKGMLHYFTDPVKSKQVLEKHGEAKLADMMRHLNDPDHILLTRNTIIPKFLDSALKLKTVLV